MKITIGKGLKLEALHKALSYVVDGTFKSLIESNPGLTVGNVTINFDIFDGNEKVYLADGETGEPLEKFPWKVCNADKNE